MLDRQSDIRRAPINLADSAIVGRCGDCEARHIGLCDAMPDQDLHFLANVAKRHKLVKGQCFVIQGDPARHFFNINHGSAKLYKDMPDGRRQIVGFVGSGDFVGLAAAQTYAFSAEAMEDIGLCRFDRSELRAVFGLFPAIERRLLDVASHELVVAQEQMLLLGRKNAIERVASFLDVWRHRTAACTAGEGALDLPMSRTDLSDYLGLTVETVSRALTALRKQGVIAIGADHRVAILQSERLTDIAQAAA
ncbi:Crp/Fnr family transcriptional regulator [Acidiphilium sp.]|uniref:Crp/Fnr family transcriptional regulator n=1 Tax=Acidiphilium sp. TaxID=527 RepID=UPI003D0517EC